LSQSTDLYNIETYFCVTASYSTNQIAQIIKHRVNNAFHC